MIKCPHCNTDNLDDAVFCKECGFKIEVNHEQDTIQKDSIKCKKCSTENPVGAIFCQNCGCKIEEKIIDNSNKDKAIIKFSVNRLPLLLIGAITLICVFVILIISLKDNNVDKENNENINTEIQEELEAEKVEEHVHEYVLESISATMHRKTCKSSECDYCIEEECTFINGECECGNKAEKEKEIVDEIDDKQELLEKISGVWGCESNYFLNFDGGDGFNHGWLYSDMLPYNHITNCKKIDENIYEVELFVEGYAGDDESDGWDSYTWTATFDGSYDGFKSFLRTINDEGKESYYVYLSENLDKAIEDYDFEETNYPKYKQKLKEYYEAKGIIFDDETICGLARKYYKEMNGEEPPLVSIDSRKGDEITIHLYEIMEYEDYPEENHATTWGWYTIDAYTLEGTDFFGMPVDLNRVR